MNFNKRINLNENQISIKDVNNKPNDTNEDIDE